MDFRAIAMGMIFALMWSSAFTSARMIVVDAPPLMALALRFWPSGALGVGIAWALGQTWRISGAQRRAVVIFGVMQNAAYLGLNFIAMQYLEASVAAIIASTMPLIVALAGWAFFGDRLRPLGAVGLAAGFGGVLLIMGARLDGGVDPYGLALCLGGAVALSIATLTLRGAAGGQGGNLLMIVGLQMLVGAAVLTVCAALFETWAVTWSLRLVLAFLYTSLVPGLLATWVWFALIARIGALKGATFHFLNPFFGVAIAAVILGERIGISDIIGVLVIAAGILAVQLSKQQSPT